MTKMQTKHAEQVVERFKELLSQSGRQHVGEKHFEQLALLIESAIDAALIDEVETYASQLEQMVAAMRNSEEHYQIESESPTAAVQ